MSAKFNIRLGQSDFLTLRGSGGLYVDKTRFILNVLDAGYDTVLCTRPRRFGKTLNMTTLKAFLEKSPVNVTPYFEGLEVWKSDEARQHFQRYPVLMFSFRTCKGKNWETTQRELAGELRSVFTPHRYLTGSPALTPDQREWVEFLLNPKTPLDQLGSSLRFFSECLHQHHGERVVILIDEYDTPIHKAVTNGYYDDIISFFRIFLGAALKDNPHLFKGVLTGILRVSKEGMFSDLNNIGVYTLLRDEFKSDFGFTEEEVMTLLSNYELSSLADGMRDTYNGYLFGRTNPVAIYNPWSVLSCLSSEDHVFRAYWMNTGSTELMNQLLLQHGDSVKEQLEALLAGDSIEVDFDENVVMRSLETSENALFSFLLFAGYLKPKNTDYDPLEPRIQMTIPNREVRLAYTRFVEHWFKAGLKGGEDRVRSFTSALLNGELQKVQEGLSSILLTNTSYMDGATRQPERFYHGLVLGLLVALEKDYAVRSNPESGLGRVDLLIRPKTPGKPGVVMELKVTLGKNGKQGKQTIQEALLDALDQILERRYLTELEASGAHPIQAYGAAFDGKEVVLAKLEDRERVAQKVKDERVQRLLVSASGVAGAAQTLLKPRERIALRTVLMTSLPLEALSLLADELAIDISEEQNQLPLDNRWAYLIRQAEKSGAPLFLDLLELSLMRAPNLQEDAVFAGLLERFRE